MIGFNLCDRCEFSDGPDAAAAHLDQALLAAAGQRGISRGQLFGFIAQASALSVAADAFAPTALPDWAAERVHARQAPAFGAWPRKGEAPEAQAC